VKLPLGRGREGRLSLTPRPAPPTSPRSRPEEIQANYVVDKALNPKSNTLSPLRTTCLPPVRTCERRTTLALGVHGLALGQTIPEALGSA